MRLCLSLYIIVGCMHCASESHQSESENLVSKDVEGPGSWPSQLTAILGRPLIYCIGDKDKPHLLIYYTCGLLASYVPGDSHPQLLTACSVKTPEEGLRDLIMCMTESRNTRGGVMSL